jgi:hypothetical protein
MITDNRIAEGGLAGYWQLLVARITFGQGGVIVLYVELSLSYKTITSPYKAEWVMTICKGNKLTILVTCQKTTQL